MNRVNYNDPRGQLGQREDEYMAHVAPGEIIVPPAAISDEMRARLLQEMLDAGIDPSQYVVGEGMSINPETGLPQFFFKKVFKSASKFVNKIIPKEVAPFAAPALGLMLGPAGFGLTGALGAGLAGAGLGGIQSGSLKGALAGGLGAYGAAGGGAGLGGALGGPGSLLGGASGLSAAAQEGLGGALLGAAGGGISGGLKGALTGGIGSGLGAYVGAGGLGDIGSMFGNSSGSSAYGEWANPNLPWLGEVASGAANANPAMKMGLGDMIKDGLSGSGFGALTKYAAPASSMLGGLHGYMAQGDIEDELRKGLGQAEGALAPFANAQFNPGDLTQDPGYQFQLQQGQQALDRTASARGNVFSGQALKEAQQFGQGLADQTYQDSFMRWLQGQNLNYRAASDLANIYGLGGAVGAGRVQGEVDSLGKALSGFGQLW